MRRYLRHWRASIGTSLFLLTCSLFSLVSAGQYTSPYVILQGTLATSSGNPAPNATLTLVPSQVCFVPGQSVVVEESQCSSDVNGNVVGTGNPVSGPQVNVQYVGTLPTGNYYVVFSWYDQFGIQSLKSPEVAAQLTHAGELQILPPAGTGPPNAVGMAVYIGTAPGAETFQGLTLTTTAQFTQAVPLGFPVGYITIASGGVFPSCPTLYTFTASDAGNGASAVPVCASIGGGNVQLVGFQALTGGQSYTVPPTVSTNGTPSVAPVLSATLNTAQTPPIRNLTACRVVANDACFPTGTGYTASLVDASGNNLFNYSEMWQFFGPGSTYNLSQGIPYYHGQVTYPIPILTIPFNHNPQAVSGPLSLSGYNLYNVGAVGVGTATPAWGVDVEGTGLDALINAKGGYLINGGGGAAGACITSDGTAFDTVTTVCGKNPNIPAVVPGGGLGVGGTAVLGAGSNDGAGEVTVVAGSGGGSPGVVFTLTFGGVYVGPTFCVFAPTNNFANAVGAVGNAAVLPVISTSLGASTGGIYIYNCHQ